MALPLRIAHLTDQHFGRVTSHRVQLEAIRLANASRADIVCLTGDFVAHSCGHLDALVEALSGLDRPAFAVLGNHDHWNGAADVRSALSRAGVEVLDNVHTQITVNGHRINVAGVDDSYTGHADFDKTMRGLDTRIPTLALAHVPEDADRLWARGAEFVLSGHTHAGQLTVARLHELSVGKVAGHRYVHGLYGDRKSAAVYVGAGVGASVFPFRVGDRGKREVAVFDLGTRPGALDEHHQEQEPLKGRAPSEKTKAKRRARVHKKAAKRARRGAGLDD
ncbi:MAG: putative MPP superfamily phosphohydrolase [Cognaticolwellia sp.]